MFLKVLKVYFYLVLIYFFCFDIDNCFVTTYNDYFRCYNISFIFLALENRFKQRICPGFNQTIYILLHLSLSPMDF